MSTCCHFAIITFQLFCAVHNGAKQWDLFLVNNNHEMYHVTFIGTSNLSYMQYLS